MTNKIIFSIVAIVLLASCSNKYSLVKRKYNKGYYVSVTKNHSEIKNGSGTRELTNRRPEKTKQANTKELSEVVMDKKSVSTVQLTKISSTTPEKIRNERSGINGANNKITASVNKNDGSSRKAAFNTLDIKKQKVIASKKKTSDSDANTILLVILCIFIPPLAVFLFEKKISVNFWVDLILCLLFWLPGIIFAFLVCFARLSL